MNAFPISREPEVQTSEPRAPRRKTSVAAVLLSLAGFAVTFGLWLLTRSQQTDALRDVPAAQRRELFETTRRTLLAVCNPASRPAGLDAYCSEQARFILEFDACDAECRDLSLRSQPLPRR